MRQLAGTEFSEIDAIFKANTRAMAKLVNQAILLRGALCGAQNLNSPGKICCRNCSGCSPVPVRAGPWTGFRSPALLSACWGAAGVFVPTVAGPGAPGGGEAVGSSPDCSISVPLCG